MGEKLWEWCFMMVSMTMVFHHHGMEEGSGRGMEGDEIVGKKRGGVKKL